MKRKTNQVLIFTTIAEALGRPHGFWLMLFSVFWQVSRSSAFAGLEGEVIITFLSYLLAFGVTFYTILLMSHVLLDCVFLTVDFWWAYIKTVIRFHVSHIYWKHFIIYVFLCVLISANMKLIPNNKEIPLIKPSIYTICFKSYFYHGCLFLS